MATSGRHDLKDALDAIERLIGIFRIDRYLYLLIASLSAALFFYAAFRLFSDQVPSKAHIVALLGSSGVATAVTARVIYIFNKAFSLVEFVVHRTIGFNNP